VTASPPPGSALQPVTQPALLDIGTTRLNFVLPGPVPPPPGVTVNGYGTAAGGIPILFWGASTPISYTGGCVFGRADWSVTAENTQTGAEQTVTGSLTETPAGSGDYDGTLPPLRPMHGQGTLTISISCPNPAHSQTVSVSIYIDPSGTVVHASGNPIPDATVTLLRSDDPAGPFTAVPDGSALVPGQPSQPGPDARPRDLRLGRPDRLLRGAGAEDRMQRSQPPER
jgi:hypothetical protein